MTERKAPIGRYRLSDVRRCRLCRSFSAIGGTISIVPCRGSWTSTSAPASTETIWSQVSPVLASIGHPCARSSGIGTTDHGGTWHVKIRAGPARSNWTMIISRLVFIDRFCTVLNCNKMDITRSDRKWIWIFFLHFADLYDFELGPNVDLCKQKFLLCNYMSPVMEHRNWKTLYFYFNFNYYSQSFQSILFKWFYCKMILLNLRLY